MENGKKIDYYIEMALVFVLGILAGVAIKVEANRTIAIGYDDYKMKFSGNQYNINVLQKIINEAVVQTDDSAAKNNSEQNNQSETLDNN